MSGPLKLSDVQGFVSTTVPQFIRTIPAKCRWIREVVQHEFRSATPAQKKAAGVALSALALILFVSITVFSRKANHKPDTGSSPQGTGGSSSNTSSNGAANGASSTSNSGTHFDPLDEVDLSAITLSSKGGASRDPQYSNTGSLREGLDFPGSSQVIPLPSEQPTGSAESAVTSTTAAVFNTSPSGVNPTSSSPGFSSSNQHPVPPRTSDSVSELAFEELRKIRRPQQSHPQQTPSAYPPQSPPPAYPSAVYGSPYPGYMQHIPQASYYPQSGSGYGYSPSPVGGSYPPPYSYPTTPPGYPQVYHPGGYLQRSGYPQ